MWRAAFLPWPTATVTVRSAGTMSPPAKMPGWPVIRSGPTCDDAVLDLDARHAVEQDEIGLLAEREHERVGLELLELAGRLREAGLVELHPLDHELALVGVLDRRQPPHQDALLERLLDLEVVRRHPLARAAVDDDRLLGAEAPGGARGVDRGVAAAVDDDAPAEQRPLLALHAAQQRDGVEDRARPCRPGCRRACRGAPRRRGTPRRSRPRASCRGCSSTLLSSSSVTPRSRIRWISASSTSRGSRYAGCRSASSRRASGPASWISTSWPRRRRW